MYPEYDDPFAPKNTRRWSFGRQPVPNQTGIRGTILEIGKRMHSTKWNPDPNATPVLDYWDDAKTRPKEYVNLTLQTELNEPDDRNPVDDGIRTISIDIEYKRGGKMNVIQEAVKGAGGRTIEVGGKLSLWFTGLDPESKNPDNPRKLYAAKYELPVQSGAAAFMEQPNAAAFATQVQQQQQQQQQPSYAQSPQSAQNPYGQPAAAAAAAAPFNPGTGEVNPAAYPPPVAAQPPAVNPEEIKARLAAGQSDAQITAETGVPLQTISAVRNLATLQQPPQQQFSGPDVAEPPF